MDPYNHQIDPYSYQSVYTTNQHLLQQNQEPIYQTLTPINQNAHHESFKVYQQPHLHNQPEHYMLHPQQNGFLEQNLSGYNVFVDSSQQQQLAQIPQQFVPSLPLQIPPALTLPPTQTSTTSSNKPSSSTSGSSQNNTQQSHCTFKWLEANFQFRSHVSISRSTIYELYQKFCSQNAFVAVCKATFGKIIRIKFPKVKSKRLGARGQSKYHYYNITFKDERKRCSMLLSGNNSKPTSSSLPVGQRNPTLTTVKNQLQMYSPQILQQTSVDEFGSKTSIWNYNQESANLLTNDSQQEWQTANQNRQNNRSSLFNQNKSSLTSTIKSLSNSFTSNSFSPQNAHHRLTIFSNRQSPLESYSHFNLNENDYHAIIQSMLSYMRLPKGEEGSGVVPLNNDRFVFVNLYKIHCQCLLDSALSANYAQMRHYVMHFWQQLPKTVTIYCRTMAALDAHMYALLEDIYASSVDAPMEGLCRLNTVAYLLPVWLKRTFNYVVPNSVGGGGGGWALVEFEEERNFRRFNEFNSGCKSVGEMKVEEALKWSYRIKFKVDFIVGMKKIDFSQLPSVLSNLLTVFDSVYELMTSPTYNYNALETGTFFEELKQYSHSTRPSAHLFHQTGSLLWNALLGAFRSMLVRLVKIGSNKKGNEGSKTPKKVEHCEKEDAQNEDEESELVLSGQLLVDELDRLLLTVQEKMNQNSDSFTGSGGLRWSSANNHRLYSNMTLLFGRLVDDLLGWMAVEKILQNLDEQLVDEFVDDDEEEEDEIEIDEKEEVEEEKEKDAKTSAQSYLLLTSMQCYFVEICQTVLRKRRFGYLEEDEDGGSR